MKKSAKDKDPLVKRIRALAKRIQDQRAQEELEERVRKAGAGKRGKANEKAEAAERAKGIKKVRRYPPAVALPEGLSANDIADFLPSTCKASAEHLNRAWRVSAYGRGFARAWRKWGPQGAAEEIARCTWQFALDSGHELECPFKDFGVH